MVVEYLGLAVWNLGLEAEELRLKKDYLEPEIEYPGLMLEHRIGLGCLGHGVEYLGRIRGK